VTSDEVIDLLGLAPLPDEGGWWAQTWRDEHSTAIHYLVRPGDVSAMHRLDAVEVWHHYAGDPLELLLLTPDGGIQRPTLGDDLAARQRPCVAVPAGVWMGARSTGEWSLVGTTMAPPWTPERFHLGDRDELCARWPDAADTIVALTRSAP